MKTSGEAQIAQKSTTVELRRGLGQPRQKIGAKRRWWPWLLILTVLGAGGYWRLEQSKQHRTPTASAAMKPIPQNVPVVAATARQGDMPVYLTGLGSVTPLNTVTVHSRVDGQLMS